MAAGRKTGGRKKGTPNKKNQEIQARLDALNCDPIEGMARIAMDEKNDVGLRGRMFAELAQYVLPKRKAVEVSGHMEHRYVARMPEPVQTAEEWSQHQTLQ